MRQKAITIIVLLISLGMFAVAQAYADTVIFSDNFNRPDSGSVGNGWTVLEGTTGNVDIYNSSLYFADTNDLVNRPMVSHAFTKISSGSLSWSFNFNWTRNEDETDYRLFMQLGDSGSMSSNDQRSGIGVDLVWTSINDVHQLLAYVGNGTYTTLSTISGNTAINVLADLAGHDFSVSVNGFQIASGIPFDNAIGGIDTVRFFTDQLNDEHFSGRSFDNVQLSASAVPIPSALLLLGSGLIGIGGIRKKFKA
jgi:hypothetical protein